MIDHHETKATHPRRWLKLGAGLGALVSLSAATGWGAATFAYTQIKSHNIEQLRTALKLRLPKTPIDALDCAGHGGLCEVVSKTTLFYVDTKAKYLVIGRIYDMEARQDLTAARLLALNPDLLTAGAARSDRRDTAEALPRPARPTKISLAELPAKGAINWGPASGPKLIVFSDFQCSYCRKLSEELKSLGGRVEERPISIFGAASRKLSEQVYCSANPAAALHSAYGGLALASARPCDTSGLDANEAFAKKHGFGGTPVIVRPSDGAVIEGYRSASDLRKFLNVNPKRTGA
jgi:thiol:disulfide interchange protein DsbC